MDYRIETQVEISDEGTFIVSRDREDGRLLLEVGDITIEMGEEEASELFVELMKCLTEALSGEKADELVEMVREEFAVRQKAEKYRLLQAEKLIQKFQESRQKESHQMTKAN